MSIFGNGFLGSVISGATSGGAVGSPWGAALGAGLGLAGSIFSGKQEAAAAKDQRDWQTYMSNTAHTREVADLRNAGLNPILSATGGGGASTPSGAVARVPDYGSAAKGMVDSVLQRQLLQAQRENIDHDSELKVQQEHGQATANQIAQVTLENARATQPADQGKKYTDLASQNTAIDKTVAEIKNLGLTGESTGIDLTRKQSDLKMILSDPVLQKYILSASYGDQAFLAKLMADPSASDIAKLLFMLAPHKN